MANPSKDKGTAFETAVVRYLREALADDRIERRALHGNRDMGDIYGIRAHGAEVIAECKCHREVTPARIGRWREQTLVERGNSDADAALLIVSVYRAPVSRSRVHMTLRDLMAVMDARPEANPGDLEYLDGIWAVVELSDLVRIIEWGI